MAKAYDRVHWDSLFQVLVGFGFSNQFCNLVKECEILSRLLRKQFEDGCIGKFYHPLGTPLILHLLYADDILMFLNGENRSLRQLCSTLSCYERRSWQCISREKFAIFGSPTISSARKRSLVRLTGFAKGNFLVMYLGVPLVRGQLKAGHFDQLIVKIRANVAGWKAKLFSQGGRLIFLNHVLSSMASHLMAVLEVPQIVLKKINSILSTFFWGEHNGKAKIK
ncbi:uncharacterized protein LOC121238169 [Juglans microcarpa x Juglans regia]|uniref:uncharacterized protein LOC121238169 n=1 Tax=Juglans microcarpa x Juglans regia TaxID=2249226 RepID=UPI001B7F4C99|nr:uncharacterized protein LOC121238169 [Juglans microcarpa x Juglans regia]